MAPATAVEVQFAQKLAGNDKTTRDRALRKLRKWIRVRTATEHGSFSEEDLLKVWKGLHYCMWMSDKPLIQEELANNIASLIVSFGTLASQFQYIDTYFKTMSREWYGIDRLRMDKYMMFVRRFFRQCLALLKQRGWKKADIQRFLTILRAGMINGKRDTAPDGLKFHIADIYLEELATAGAEQLTKKQVLVFLEPYCVMLYEADSEMVVDRIYQRVFDGIIGDRVVELFKEQQGQEEDDEEEEEDDPSPKLKYNYKGIADRLFELASQDSCKAHNRRQMFVLVTKLRDLLQKQIPESEMLDEDSDASLGEEDVQKALGRLKDFEVKLRQKDQITEKKKKKKKKRKNNIKGNDEDEPAAKKNKGEDGIEENESSVAPSQKKLKKKNKKKLGLDESTDKENCENNKQDSVVLKPQDIVMNGVAPTSKKSKKKKAAAKEMEGESDVAATETGSAEKGVKSTKKAKKGKSLVVEGGSVIEGSTAVDESAILENVGKAKGKKRKSTGGIAVENAISADVVLETQVASNGEVTSASTSSKKSKKRQSLGSEANKSLVEEVKESVSISEDVGSVSSSKKSKKRKSLVGKEVVDSLSNGSPVATPVSTKKGKKKNASSPAESPVTSDASRLVAEQEPASHNTPLTNSGKKKNKKQKNMDSPVVAESDVVSTPTIGSAKKGKKQINIEVEESTENNVNTPKISSAKKGKKQKHTEMQEESTESSVVETPTVSSAKKGKKQKNSEDSSTPVPGSGKKGKKLIGAEDGTESEEFSTPVANSGKKNKTKKNKGEGDSMVESEEFSTPVADSGKKNKKQKSSAKKSAFAMQQEKLANEEAAPTPEPAPVSEAPPSSKKKNKKGAANPFDEEPAQEGEVEILIPNKKYKAPLKDAFAKQKEKLEAKQRSESPFVSFTQVKTPQAAFVKRAVGKGTPKGTPKTDLRKELLSQTLDSATGTKKRRVSFVMSKNMEQDFDESLNVSPVIPFDPKVNPSNGILKTPSSDNKPVPSKKELQKRRRSLGASPLFAAKNTRSKASDFF